MSRREKVAPASVHGTPRSAPPHGLGELSYGYGEALRGASGAGATGAGARRSGARTGRAIRRPHAAEATTARASVRAWARATRSAVRAELLAAGVPFAVAWRGGR
jgi:hypothetical protein